ncbi:putative fatty acyl-CoA reductase CG5065 isoform X2 [Artemia franciscana]|uniref:putative fatty acyl-CoA reductase CG5065 isoform X2 n=1 Tax=Artemia franciscana TaxID=6661 RepID=UPI0032DBD4D3
MASEIVNFYRDRSVFITGGTGFFGKILIEKLLRSCPGLKNIYVLIRPKAGQDPKNRLQDLLSAVAFDNIRQNHPEFFSKVIPVSGDISRDELGISPQDLQMMSETVSIAFHSAAIVRFDEPLKSAIELNVKGVKRMLSVCKKLENLEVLVHVSTAYVNSTRTELDETIYRPLCDVDNLISTLDWLDDQAANSITKSLLNGAPNTYTFSKSLGEAVLNSEAGEVDFKIVIIRPSIVTASWKEPIPGWVDSLGGTTGWFAGSAAGIFRTMYCHTQMAVDLIPGEFPVNLMVTSAWDALKQKSQQQINPTVFLASTGQNPVTWAQCKSTMYPLMFEYPFSKAVWPPTGSFKNNTLLHRVDQFLYHIAPAYLLDGAFRICGRKPFMVRLHKKATKVLDCVQFYTTHEWRTRSDNTCALIQRMNAIDRAIFNFDSRTIDWDEYLCTYYLGIRKFVLKDELHTLPAARTRMRRLLVAQFSFRLALAVLIARTLLRKSETARTMWHMFGSTVAGYFVSLTSQLF